jgi:hypothetical protein
MVIFADLDFSITSISPIIGSPIDKQDLVIIGTNFGNDPSLI